MNIDISREDVEFLILLLEREYKNALVEQHHTAHNDYKQIVKARIAEIEKLTARMKEAV